MMSGRLSQLLVLSGLLAASVLSGASRPAGAAAPSAEESPSLSPRHATVAQWSQVAMGLSDAEQTAARALFDKLEKRAPLSASDADSAAELAAHHSQHRPVRALGVVVLVSAAYQEAAARDCDAGLDHLQQARAIDEEGAYVSLATLDVLVQCGAWREAEAAAREVLARDPANADAAFGLGYALMRQDRDQEALEAWDATPRLREHPLVLRLRERLAKNLAVESGFRETRVSHFSLRYDGDRHEAVGERVLEALEGHFSTLVSAFDYQPSEPITVIVLTREAYLDSTGAPGWSGGEFSGFDGRVRVPILGLTPDRVRDIEGTLMHELTHVFVHDISHGTADWVLQEGLAQYMEGKRAGVVAAADKTAIAKGSVEEVRQRYLLALSFVEFLLGQGDQTLLNMLLAQMGKGGDADGAWRGAYGRSLTELRSAWLETLRTGGS
jgi:hypothetical protein